MKGAQHRAEIEPHHAADADARNATPCGEPVDGPWVKAENACHMLGARQRDYFLLRLLHPFAVADTTVVGGDIQSFVAPIFNSHARP